MSQRRSFVRGVGESSRRSARFVAGLPLNVAAHARTLIPWYVFACEHRVEGSSQVRSRDRLAVSRSRVVQLAVVGQAAVTIEDEEVRGAGRPIRPGHLLALV